MERNFESAKTATVYNKIYACGRVVGYGRTPSGIRTFTLLIRGSQSEGRPARNIVLNVAYGRAADDHPDGIPIRSMIEMEGHLVSYSYRNEIFDRWGYVQYIEADKIEFIKPELEESFGVPGFSYKRSYVQVYLKGEVTRVTKTESTNEGRTSTWVNLSIRTSNSSRQGRGVVRVQFSSRMRVNDVGASCKEGDIVCLIGTFSTNTKTDRSGNRTNFENVIVDDMRIIEKKDAAKDAQRTAGNNSSARNTDAGTGRREDRTGDPLGTKQAEQETAMLEEAVKEVTEKTESEKAAAEEDSEETLESLIRSM